MSATVVLPAVVFLLLCAAPVGAGALQFVCWPIVRGDTASGLALRLTGNAAAAYSEAFQINDPARRMFVPKSSYGRLSPHWQACVVRELAPNKPRARAQAVAPPGGSRYDVGFAVKVSAAVSVMLLMCSVVAGYAAARPIPPAMQRAGEDFIRAFARPLADPSSDVPPIAVRLRFVHRAKQLEICIAPGGGRRYPNLSDHKTNVEYDVNRVLRLLGTHCVVSDRLRAEGKWVIVPIRLAERKGAGAR